MLSNELTQGSIHAGLPAFYSCIRLEFCRLDGGSFSPGHAFYFPKPARTRPDAVDGCGREAIGTELLHEVAELGVIDLANLHGAEVGQDCFLYPVLQDAQSRAAQFTPGDSALLHGQCR